MEHENFIFGVTWEMHKITVVWREELKDIQYEKINKELVGLEYVKDQTSGNQY